MHSNLHSKPIKFTSSITFVRMHNIPFLLVYKNKKKSSSVNAFFLRLDGVALLNIIHVAEIVLCLFENPYLKIYHIHRPFYRYSIRFSKLCYFWVIYRLNKLSIITHNSYILLLRLEIGVNIIKKMKEKMQLILV